MRVFPLVFLNELVQIDCLVSDVLWTLLVGFQAQGVAALVHVHRAKPEAENVKLARLSRALTVALAIYKLLIRSALLNELESWLDASTIVVDHAIGANWSTNIALCHNEGRRAARVPVILTLLTALTLLALSISTPERKWFFTALLSLLEELGTLEAIIEQLGIKAFIL